MIPIDRPSTLTLKDYLIRKVSVKSMINERTILDIINFQFTDGKKALHDNAQVELSGFGKFIFQEKKALKEKERLIKIKGHLLDKELTPKIEGQLISIDEELEFINSKLNSNEPEDTEADHGGVSQ